MKLFHLLVNVSEGITQSLVAEGLALAARDLRGPRGGRYVAVDEPWGILEQRTTDDVFRGTRTITGHVHGRYVRPNR